MQYSEQRPLEREGAAGRYPPSGPLVEASANEPAPDLPRLEQSRPEGRQQRTEKSFEGDRAAPGTRQLPGTGTRSGGAAASALGHGFSTARATYDGRLG